MNGTILLIDYDPSSICRIQGMLSAIGLRPIVARDGVAGIDAFLRHLPDLTLIQDLIPRKHGFDVCRELKATEHGRRSAIILLADLRNGRRYAALSTGCDDFVPKPIDGQMLIEKVRKFLSSAEPPPADTLPSSCPGKEADGIAPIAVPPNAPANVAEGRKSKRRRRRAKNKATVVP